MYKNLKTKPIFFIYARKSSDNEDRQIQSIEDQIKHLQLIAKKSNFQIKEVFIEAKTAKMPYCRPIFENMIKRIEKGEANGILCWHLNRLFRNPVDQGTIGWMLQQGTIQSIQTMERQYLPEDNVLLFSVEGGMANQFIIDLRKSSWRGMEGKADRGWLPSVAPIGYLNDKLEHTIVNDKERFELVRRMWDLMLTGNYTPVKILNLANDKWGFRTPRKKRMGGKKLSISGIYRIFANVFYTGMFEWAGTRYKGNHKPMITIEEYDRVQVILGKEGKPKFKKHEFAFTGIMRCGECGGMITATEKQKLIQKTGEVKSFIYYHCTHKIKGVTCTQTEPITLQEIENQIGLLFQKFTILPQFRQWALEILTGYNKKEIEERTHIYETQHKALVSTQKELDNLTQMRYRDLIDDETYIIQRNTLKSKIAILQEQIDCTENRAVKWLELTERTFNFVTYASKTFVSGTLEQKREIFVAIGQNFLLKDKKVSIEASDWLIPIEKAYPTLEAEYKRLELREYVTDKERNAAFASLILRWGAVVEDIRTVFVTKNDMTVYIPTCTIMPDLVR